MKTKVCRSCGYVGKPEYDAPITFVFDLVVWTFWFVIAGITGIFPLVVVGPLYTIYHLLVFHSRQCPKCHNMEMVNVDSEDGRHIMEPHEGGIHSWTDNHTHAQ